MQGATIAELRGRADLRDEARAPPSRGCTLWLIGKPRAGIVLNATFDGPGDIVFKHACALGCEGS
jgi:hypothetical protein